MSKIPNIPDMPIGTEFKLPGMGYFAAVVNAPDLTDASTTVCGKCCFGRGSRLFSCGGDDPTELRHCGSLNRSGYDNVYYVRVPATSNADLLERLEARRAELFTTTQHGTANLLREAIDAIKSLPESIQSHAAILAEIEKLRSDLLEQGRALTGPTIHGIDKIIDAIKSLSEPTVESCDWRTAADKLTEVLKNDPIPPWNAKEVSALLGVLKEWAIRRHHQFSAAAAIRDAADVVNGKKSQMQATVDSLREQLATANDSVNWWHGEAINLREDKTQHSKQHRDVVAENENIRKELADAEKCNEKQRTYIAELQGNVQQLIQQLAEAEAKGREEVVEFAHDRFCAGLYTPDYIRSELKSKFAPPEPKPTPETMNRDEMLEAMFNGERVKHGDMADGSYVFVMSQDRYAPLIFHSSSGHEDAFLTTRAVLDREDWHIVESEAPDE